MSGRSVQLLGPINVEWAENVPPRFRSPRAQAILAYLVAERRPISRDKLASLFWPDDTLANGRASLRRELYNLGAILPDCWDINQQTAQFTPTSATYVDVDRLQQLERQQRWSEAALLIRGEFLEGFQLADNLEFETWLLGERERHQQQAERVLAHAAKSEQRQGNYRRARRHLARLLQILPFHEQGHRQMMLLLAREGRFSAALKQYEQCRVILAEELDVSPSITTTELRDRIKSAMRMPPHNLPPQPTPFIGREKELAEVTERLTSPECRMLTLTGVGGIGKSRLALESARLVAADDFRLFLHGVVFVPLVGVDERDLISTIGDALGLSYGGQHSPENQLLRYLQDLELLLLLDNYEHFLPDTDCLAKILKEAPEVRLLITSRERLNLQQEWLFKVDGLPYPDDEFINLAREKEPDYGALRLFQACARRVQRTLSLEASGRAEMTSVVAICRLVQGMPLALELSAARLKYQSAAEVLAELEQHGLDMLVTENRNMPARHASLRAAFDVSWADLSMEEQKVLCQLSLFRAGFTREAAARVTGATLSILTSLGDKSLIRWMPSGRYEMHELLRQYAAEKLAADSEIGASAHEQFAVYYGKFLQAREQGLLETDQEATLKELSSEIENIRVAWRWLVRNKKVEVLDGALWTLAVFHQLRGQIADGLVMVEEALTGISELENRGKQLQARLRLFQGCFLYFSGRLPEARNLLASTLDRLRLYMLTPDLGYALFLLGQTSYELDEANWIAHIEEAYTVAHASGQRWLEGFLAARLAELLSLEAGEPAAARSEQYLLEAISIGKQLDNPWLLGETLLTAGCLETNRGAYPEAERALEQALAAAQRVNLLWLMGMIFWHLGYVTYMQGKFALARQYCSENLLFSRRIDAGRMHAYTFALLGDIARALGNPGQAVDYYRQRIALLEELGIPQPDPWSACSLGHVFLQQSNVERAIDYFHACLLYLADKPDGNVLSDRRDRVYRAGMALAGTVGVLIAWGRSEQAARLAGAAAACFAPMIQPLEPADQQDWDRILAGVAEALDEETFAGVWNEGQQMPLGQALASALEVEGPVVLH